MSTIAAPQRIAQVTAPIVGVRWQVQGRRPPRRSPWLGPPTALAVLVATLAAVLLLATGLVGPSQADVHDPAPLTVVVRPGDTIWQLARAHAPAGTSVQEYAALVVEHNGVTATALRPGTVVELPR